MTKNNTPRSSGGKGPLRDWASKSYSSSNGRSASSVFENGDSGRGWTNAGADVNNQIPGGFERRTARTVQDRRPVRTREFTKVVD
jgi:hypothetical protein